MRNNDPSFRSVIANLEKASTGDLLKNALVKYEELNVGPTIDSTSGGSNIRDSLIEYSGALPTLYRSHTANMNGLSPEWGITPVIGPGEKLVDSGDYEYVDQDGNPIDV